MSSVRANFTSVAFFIDAALPEGPEKTYIMRHLRGCAMWANVALTRNPDGSPRRELPVPQSNKSIVVEPKTAHLPRNEPDSVLEKHAIMSQEFKGD
jgi:hypothetical protein